MKILITGFEPFGGDIINPSYEMIRNIDKNFRNVDIETLQVPVVFGKSVDVVTEHIEKTKPDVVIMFGQAGGRYDISVERVAINVDDARIADNSGNQPVDEAIDNNGAAAYFSTLPIKAIVEGVKKANIPASISNSAGTYVCNHLMYGVLNYIHKNNLNIKSGFIHIPFLLEQVVNRYNAPAMDINTMIKAAEKIVETIINTENDIRITGGTIC